MRVAVLVILCALSGQSQESAVYKVEFDIHKGTDDQHLSMLVDESRKGVFQAATRVPMAGGAPQYVDVGVSIECAVHEADGKVELRGSIDLSSITGYVNAGAISQPVIGQRKVAFDTKAVLGAPAVIMNDRSRVEATVTRVR